MGQEKMQTALQLIEDLYSKVEIKQKTIKTPLKSEDDLKKVNAKQEVVIMAQEW